MGKVSYYIMSRKGYLVLQALVKYGYRKHIEQVIYAEDINVVEDYTEEIKNICITNNIDNFIRQDAPKSKAGFIVAISWRWLIPVTNNQKIIVLHDSLLPKYRGFAPLVSALINGEKKLGVTALFASEQYDRGPIIKQTTIDVQYPLKINDAIDKISNCYVILVLDIMKMIISNQVIKTVEQEESEITYSLWRDEKDYNIDWSRDATYLEKFINATGFPYKGAVSSMGKELIRIEEAIALDDVVIENRTPGKVIFVEKGNPVIVCGNGLLKIISAFYVLSGEAVLPIKKFRLRFT